MTNWRIEYIDTLSEGKKNTTYHYGKLTKEEVVEFFGLDRSDVLWYNVSPINEKDNE